jgi:hypothetical protein
MDKSRDSCERSKSGQARENVVGLGKFGNVCVASLQFYTMFRYTPQKPRIVITESLLTER